jgi:hypothetical protein
MATGKDELTVEGIDAIMDDMGKGYRFRPIMQYLILGIVIFIIAFVLQMTHVLDFNVEGEVAITTLIFFWITAFLFPLVVKSKSHRVNQIAMGLYWAAILSLTGTIILLIVVQAEGIQPTSIPLLIAFLAGIGSMLFEHLHPDVIGRTTKVYFAIFGVAVVFFICVWLYMEYVIPGYGIWLAILTTALFTYALLPEKPK